MFKSLPFFSVALVFCLSIAVGQEEVTAPDTSRTYVPLCGRCHYDYQCASRVCVHNKCVASRTSTSIAFCFRRECASCTLGSQCGSHLYCIRWKCIFRTITSVRKCFPSPTPSKTPAPRKGECDSCRSTTECGPHLICFRQGSVAKCIFRSPTSLKKCFPSPSPTSSKTPAPTPSRTPSRTPAPTPSRTPSRTPAPTPSRTPSRTPAPTPSRTPSRTPAPTPSRTPAPKIRECGTCSSTTDCATSLICKTIGGARKCVFNTEASLEKCFGKGECASCSEDDDCRTDQCFMHKCIFNTFESKKKCGLLKGECEGCHKDEECESHKCYHYKCIEGPSSIKKCFH